MLEAADCNWLVEAIAGLQSEFDDTEFQLWDLDREFDDEGEAQGLILTCTPVVSSNEDDPLDASTVEVEDDDDDIRQVVRTFDHPEFPLLHITFYVSVEDGTRTLSLETETTQADERTTFLLLWNPNYFQFEEGEVVDNIATIEEYGVAFNRWSTGNTKKIQPGDRMFLLRLGVEPRGIVASGYAAADVTVSEHWDPEKQAEGMTTCFVEVQWDEMLDSEAEPILLKSDLEKSVASVFARTIQSCISVKSDAALKLEAEWAKLLSQRAGSNSRADITDLQQDKEQTTPKTADSGNEANPVMEDVVMEISRAGFGDPATNRRVEIAAVGKVTQWYESEGWSVASVERDNCGYDLLCRRDGREEHVEVKGTQGKTPAFIITANEYRQSQADEMFKLCVVVSALSTSAEMHTYNGADLNNQFEMQPLAYRAMLRKVDVE